MIINYRSPFIIILFSFLLSSCKKDNLLTSQQQQPTVNKEDQIKKWLQANYNPLTPNTNFVSKKVLEDGLFDKMYMEKLNAKEDLFIIPLKNDYFSKTINGRSSANAKNSHPQQYFIVVQNSNGKIRRGDLVLFYPKDSTLISLPQNALHDFFTKQSFPVDGTLALVSINDHKQFEIDFNKGKTKEFRLRQGRQKLGGRTARTIIIDWYDVTTVYVDGDPVFQSEEYLGSTYISDCADEACTVDNGGGDLGGNGGEDLGFQTTVDVGMEVWHQYFAYEEDWIFAGVWRLSGKIYTNTSYNFFNDIEFPYGPTITYNYPDVANSLWHLSTKYSYLYEWNTENAIIGTGYNTASCRLTGQVKYPNDPAGPQLKTYSMVRAYQAAVVLY